MHWITSSVKPKTLDLNEIYYPLLNIVYFKPKETENCDIAIFTSQHGVVECNFTKAFVVGKKTELHLNKNNIKLFKNVASLIKELSVIAKAKIIYFRGRNVTNNLDFLSKKNTFISKIVYEANAIPNLSYEIINLISNNKITKVTINSIRSYDIFKNLILLHNLNINQIEVIKKYG